MIKTLKSGFTPEDRKKLRLWLGQFLDKNAYKLGYPKEAVVLEIRYWQQSASKYGTNPNRAQQAKSFKTAGRKCSVCREIIKSIADATFHHLKRGIPNQHSPKNMVPLHKNSGCHEKLHNAPAGSLTSGSMKRKTTRL